MMVLSYRQHKLKRNSAFLAASFLFALLVGLTPRPALGQGDDIAKARTQYAEGQEKFDIGDIQGALEAFSKSFDAFPHFRTIFNIGLCYERLGNKLKAIDMYQRYLDWPSEVPNREEVSKKVAALKAELPVEPPPPEEPEPPVEPPPLLPTLADHPPKGKAAGLLPRTREEYGKQRPFDTAGWVLFGTGAAGIVAGSVLLGLAGNKLQDMRKAESDSVSYNPDVHDALKMDGERFQLAGWITGAVGLGTMVAGTALVLLSRFKPEVFSRVSSYTTFSHRGGGAHLVLRF